MAAVLGSSAGLEEDIARAQQLANARKKSFRAATRSSDQHTTSSSSSTSRSSSSAPAPLTTDTTFNISASIAPPSHDYGLSKDYDLPPLFQPPRSPGKLRKSRSKGSMSHRRQNSSISGGHGLTRGSVVGLFDSEQLDATPMRAEIPRLSPGGHHTAPVMPLLDAPAMANVSPPEDHAAVKSRLTAFSFGSKPPPNTRSPSPRARRGQPLLPSQLYSADSFPSPETSPVKRGSLSTPLSRPPSLLLTRPTPLAFGSPTPAGQARQLEPPSTPPTPARTKRHSHTRSNSISLPNLKLTSRPTSLGIPNSPSFPSSPSSPSNLSRPNSIQGTRLKFEPSGRGAEAEKEKDEYRRRALEKLTGSPTPSPTFPDSPGHEIALPELDDEDGSSVASSARPFSGFGSFNFGRPTSSSSTPPGLSWAANEDSPPLERWSTGFNVKPDEQDDGLGFGFTFSGSGSGPFSFGAVPSAYPPLDSTIGMGLPSTMAARPSLTRNLSVLAEVDEPEDGEYDGASDPFTTSPELASVPFSPTNEEFDVATIGQHVPIVAPTPSRLRELHLVSASSASSGPARPPSSHSPTRSNSPTKGYGTIGRGRPAPINTSFDSPSAHTTVTTPQSAGGPRRRPTSGSRGSSISYKKDCDSSSSSRDWSMSSSKAPFSPPTSLGELASPPAQPAFAPSFGGWGNMPKSGLSRPCPRPKSLAGLGFDNQGAGRVLGELEEVDEDGLSLRNPSTRIASDDVPSSAGFSDVLNEAFGASGLEYEWQNSRLELEMERDALQEDVDLWRKRCNGLEERLELEKKENGILRERVRKLGDRLSSIVSYPATRSDTSLVADLRTQLFAVKAELERERNAKLSACDKIGELEAKLAAVKITPLSTPAPVITNIIPPTPMSPDQEPGTPVISPAPGSPGMDRSPSPDPSAYRMRAWGFPRESNKTNQPRDRESFFGLSQVLRRGSSEEEREIALGGIDLPPIDFMAAGVDPSAIRAVSDPMPVTSRGSQEESTARPALTPSESAHRSTSLTSSASSALSFFTGYLPSRTKSPPLATMSGSFSGPRIAHDVIQRLPTSEDKGNVDFRGGCKCCTGDVIEL